MSRLVIVLPLVPLHVGNGFSLSSWPLHLTVAPTFVIGAALPAVISAIAPALAAHPALRIRVGADEGFGRSMTIPVSVVEPDSALTGLHRTLVAALREVGAVFDDPDFVGSGYRAHVTVTRSDRVQPGDALELRQAAIVDMSPEGEHRLRRVVWAHALGSTM